ncbi:MAG: VWA domain-containing protein, partial [Litoreibacter sp.]|nr:VWA domain-containing protein [Litoreibacter sp.]
MNLEDYATCMQKAAPEVVDTLEATFHDAARVMSPAGLHDYMEGAKGLCSLGRGHDVVLSFLEEMPAVVQECGEDVIRDCTEAAMKLSSMTSGQVIALLFASLPTAARRLGDPELLRGYLTLIHQLSAKASRGLRPMLDNIDQLLSMLTLSGLRRWANFGADAYRRDLKNLVRYFSLESADSKKMLQKERRGTLFVDTQRKLNFYLRALWGRDFFLRPTAADHEGFKPYCEDHVLHLPDAVDAIGEISGMELYRAQSAHLAAHLSYTTGAIAGEELSPAQMFLIGLVEDARVEYVAAQEFPGLQKLWGSLLAIEHQGATEHPTVPLLERFAYCLSDNGLRMKDAGLDLIADKFHAGIEAHQHDNQFSRDLGMALFQLLADRKEMPSLRILESIRVPYRDDNRIVLAFEPLDWESKAADYVPAWQRQVRKYVSAVEMANEVDCELAGDDAQEVWVCSSEFMPYEDAGEATQSFNDMWGKEPVSAPYHYQEWDYQVQLYRPDWATVYERRATKGDANEIERILVNYKPIAHKIKHIIDRLSPQGVQRERNLEDGDEIDINAAVDAMISIRMGQQPDPRITMRNVIKNRDLAVTVLLDLSESTNEKIN